MSINIDDLKMDELESELRVVRSLLSIKSDALNRMTVVACVGWILAFLILIFK